MKEGFHSYGCRLGQLSLSLRPPEQFRLEWNLIHLERCDFLQTEFEALLHSQSATVEVFI
jgi:hypothetical protein